MNNGGTGVFRFAINSSTNVANELDDCLTGVGYTVIGPHCVVKLANSTSVGSLVWKIGVKYIFTKSTAWQIFSLST